VQQTSNSLPKYLQFNNSSRTASSQLEYTCSIITRFVSKN